MDNVAFQQANVYDLPFPPDSFDLVFSHALLEHLSQPEMAVTEFQRVLRPGGILVLGKAERPTAASHLTSIGPCIYRRER